MEHISLFSSEISICGTHKNIAVYRKEANSWKRIDVVKSGTQVVDDDVEPGKTYTYTCRCLSDDGSYFLSRFNKSGWSQSFTMAACKPSSPTIMFLGDDRVMALPPEGDKFGVPKFGIDIFDQDQYLGTGVIDADEPTILRGDVFKTEEYITLYVYGLDEDENMITSYDENGYIIQRMKPADNLRVKKLGDRKYRFRWDTAYNGGKGYYFCLYRGDGELELSEEYIRCLYYDVDLSEYPEDEAWIVTLWSTTLDGYSNSAPITMDFRESDYNSDTE